MKRVLALLFLIFVTGLRAEENNKFFAFWNAPRTSPYVVPAQPDIPDILLSASSDFLIPETAELREGSINPDGSLWFLLSIRDKGPELSFKPDDDANGGTFHLFTCFDGAAFKFVQKSDAEKNLLTFFRKARTAAIDSPKPTQECCDPRPETMAALNVLLHYFPE